jgi:hypothetical protein
MLFCSLPAPHGRIKRSVAIFFCQTTILVYKPFNQIEFLLFSVAQTFIRSTMCIVEVVFQGQKIQNPFLNSLGQGLWIFEFDRIWPWKALCMIELQHQFPRFFLSFLVEKPCQHLTKGIGYQKDLQPFSSVKNQTTHNILSDFAINFWGKKKKKWLKQKHVFVH